MIKRSMKRRDFLQLGATASFVSAGIPEIIAAAMGDSPGAILKLREGATILFQGDSITDGGREKHAPKYNITNAGRDAAYNDFTVLGGGYAMLAASELLFNNPEKKWKVFNRGISGNKVYQLAERWQADCLDLKPDVLSILIGVNDFAHALKGLYNGTALLYRSGFQKLLEQTKEKLPSVQLVIGEPFGMTGMGAVTDKWYPAFDEYRSIAKELATGFKAVWIPYQRIFDEAVKKAPAAYWTYDGIHPSVPGARLMSGAWLHAVRGIR